jgi:hypothetical protein
MEFLKARVFKHFPAAQGFAIHVDNQMSDHQT